jgi:integration host factor subunit beta
MVKSELVDHLARHTEQTIYRAEEMVDAFFEIISEALITRNRVEIRGFGAFTVKDYKAYTGRNPKTGAQVRVAAKTLPVWRTGTELRQRVDAPLPIGR